MHVEHRPLGEPTPFGVGGFVGLETIDLASATVKREKRRNSDVTTLCLSAFYTDNAIVAVAYSETTEPFGVQFLTHQCRSPYRYYRLNPQESCPGLGNIQARALDSSGSKAA